MEYVANLNLFIADLVERCLHDQRPQRTAGAHNHNTVYCTLEARRCTNNTRLDVTLSLQLVILKQLICRRCCRSSTTCTAKRIESDFYDCTTCIASATMSTKNECANIWNFEYESISFCYSIHIQFDNSLFEVVEYSWNLFRIDT